mmetsp:Transcript_78821/g.190552  ORF Transcript_78821/g.190552 Transcript_78821/m.190552 type:complete len:201 (-) Transcript_78821:352-954(-)
MRSQPAPPCGGWRGTETSRRAAESSPAMHSRPDASAAASAAARCGLTAASYACSSGQSAPTVTSSAINTKPSSTSPCVSPWRRKCWCTAVASGGAASAPLCAAPACAAPPRVEARSASTSESRSVHRAACSASSTAAAASHGTNHASLRGSSHSAPSRSTSAGERKPAEAVCETVVSTMYAACGVAPWSPSTRGTTHSKQ